VERVPSGGCWHAGLGWPKRSASTPTGGRRQASELIDKLASYFPNSGTAPFWITVEQGQVAKIAQQFLP
jgi:hypothetical protein